MARLWSSGFELNSVTADVEYSASGAFDSISTTTIRSGTYAQRNVKTSPGGQSLNGYQYLSASTQGAYYFRLYIRVATLPDVQTYTVALCGNNGGLLKLAVLMNTDGTLELWNSEDSTQIGSDSAALNIDTWYMLEISYDSTTLSSTSVEAKINGTTFASGTANLGATPRHLNWGFCFVNTVTDIFFDDIAINDSSGSFQNSWPGEGEIIHLRPNADGDNNDWNNGLNPKDYTQTDEVTPDDATSYISELSDATTSSFNIDDTPAGLASNDVINCVQVGVRFASVSGGGSSAAFALQIKSDTGATIEQSSSITPTATTYSTNTLAAPRNYSLTLYDLPGASTTSWTKATLDTAQIGVDTTTLGAKESRVSTLWLLVDHKPGTVVASTGSTNFMTTNTKFW